MPSPKIFMKNNLTLQMNILNPLDISIHFIFMRVKSPHITTTYEAEWQVKVDIHKFTDE